MATGTDYLAKPCGTCCVKGVIHDGVPRGKLEDVLGIETYVTKPHEDKANGNILLYFADIFGMGTTNTLIMDSYAFAGYLVLGLDYFQKDPISEHMNEDKSLKPDFDFESWKDKHMKFAIDSAPRWVSGVKAKYGKSNTKYACVGYCFGAPFVMDELAGDTVTAGAFAHPAFLKDEHFQNISKPLFLSCAGNDIAFGTDARRKAMDILETEKKDYHVQIFPGVEHGFALKGDITKPYERFTKEQSLAGIVAWFDFWLSQ